MPRRARNALIGAAVGTFLLVLTWYFERYVGFARRTDASILRGFLELHRPGLDRLTSAIADLCDPKPYVVLSAIPVVVALLRGRPRVAATLALILLGANETTQLLKPLLATPRAPVPAWQIDAASWPSGHATAAMSLALCSVIAAPARRRPVVAAVMAAFAIAVSYSFLELGWHYPSDVLGGFLMATIWTLAGVAGLTIFEARRSGQLSRLGDGPPSFSLGEALAPAGAVLGAAIAFGGLLVLARPHEVVDYVRVHETFMAGALVIAALGLTLAAGLTLMLRRGG